MTFSPPVFYTKTNAIPIFYTFSLKGVPPSGGDSRIVHSRKYPLPPYKTVLCEATLFNTHRQQLELRKLFVENHRTSLLGVANSASPCKTKPEINLLVYMPKDNGVLLQLKT